MTRQRTQTAGLEPLYRDPIPARRAGPLYSAFSYPTKIDPEAIALFIASHTAPNDVVLDVFAGSGTTGLAARLCEAPTDAMKARADALKLPVKWGPRSVILYELSVVGALLADTMCKPPDPTAFEISARRLLERTSRQFDWMYGAQDPGGRDGRLRHMIWTEVLVCPSCKATATFWELAVSRFPLGIRKSAECVACGSPIKLSQAQRVTEHLPDPILDETVAARRRLPVFVYGRTGDETWQRPVAPSDLGVLEQIDGTPIPSCVPTHRLFKGDLHRSGYHQGIDRIHHFYTRRNLIALGAL